MLSSRDLPNPGIEPESPTLQVDSLLSEPPGKPKNTGVCSLSLPSPGDLPYPGIELVSLMSPALATGFFITSTTWSFRALCNSHCWEVGG